MTTLPIYLDYAATTPVDASVAAKMSECLTIEGTFGNPASRSHRYGWIAEEAIDIAREQIADLIKADTREIVFTSGATESDNLAIKGVAEAYRLKGQHIVTSRTEHKAVLDTCAQLEHQGYDITYLEPEASGLIDMEVLEKALRDDTILVSVMQVNNETGIVQDIAAMGKLLASRDIYFHVDAAQSVGKLAIDVGELPVDLMSISAHKMYGPKGIGALYVRRKAHIQLAAQMHGGGHERGMRSGTLATHQIVGFGEACQIAAERMEVDRQHLLNLRDKFWSGIKTLGGVHVNGQLEHQLPGIINIGFEGVDGETLLIGLKDIAVSSGSACTSASVEPSYVLKAMGKSDELAHSSIRFSFGRYTTEKDIDFAIEHVKDTVTKLRKFSPQWNS